MRRVPPLLFATFFVLVAAGQASAGARFGIGGFFGYQGYKMSDINEAINAASDALSSPGDEVHIDELSGDVTWGASVKADLNPTWRVYLEYEHLKDSSGFGNLIGSISLKPSADAVLVGATYFFPSTSKARVGIGGGVGYYGFGGTSSTNITIGTTTLNGDQEFGGSTVGFHGRGDLDVTLSQKFHFDLGVGYRYAKGDAQADGEDANVELDWSGLMTRAGFTYFLQ